MPNVYVHKRTAHVLLFIAGYLMKVHTLVTLDELLVTDKVYTLNFECQVLTISFERYIHAYI